MKYILISLLFLLISCGGSGSSSNGDITPEGFTTSGDDLGFSMAVTFDSTEGEAYWTVEPLDGGQSLGICEFEVKQKSDQSTMYFKNKETDPVCSLIQIDPTSTIENVKIISRYSAVRYCVYDNGSKKCGEVNK